MDDTGKDDQGCWLRPARGSWPADEVDKFRAEFDAYWNSHPHTPRVITSEALHAGDSITVDLGSYEISIVRRRSPAAQIRRCLGYIKSRYGGGR